MCSACSGEPEDPPEALPALPDLLDHPFWAWWRTWPGEEAGGEAFPSQILGQEGPAPREAQTNGPPPGYETVA